MIWCTQCKLNEAVATRERMENGKKTTVHLCESCLSKAEKSAKQKEISLSELLRAADGKANRVCPVCKTNLASFNRTGFLGCEYCYKAFYRELAPVIARVQPDCVHRGTSPVKRLSGALFDRYEALVQDRVRALSESRFRDASEIEKELRLLEGRALK